MKNKRLLEAIHSREQVSGLTHEFYRYPARFSPIFVKEVTEAFTQPGELIFDPFLGGGTTVVESRALGRSAIGTDISSLAVFVARSKSQILPPAEVDAVREWALEIAADLNAHAKVIRDDDWAHYQRNISCKSTWPIRKLIEQALAQLPSLESESQRDLARCILLRTGQWALDTRSSVPSAARFREQFLKFANEMILSARNYSEVVQNRERETGIRTTVTCLNRSAVGIENDQTIRELDHAPKLVLTSPPYPGVHVLYHRWQVRGRRETPAPFWIAGSLDGSGSSFYNFGSRHEQNLTTYFNSALESFRSIAAISNRATTVVQMVAFNNPEWQLPRYLDVMEEAGFTEHKFAGLANAEDGRVWRSVPNRKWYAAQKGNTHSSSEVVLFHRKKSK